MFHSLEDQHAVAVTKEAVALLDCVFVGGQNHFRSALFAGEGAHQHEERRLREVEVGEQAGDDAEVVARAYKDAGLAGVRFKVWHSHRRSEIRGTRLSASHQSAVFEGSGGGCSGGDNFSLVVECGVDSGRRSGRQRVVFRVEADVREMRRAHGLEGSKTNMERDVLDLNALVFQRIQNLRGEVEARCRSGS